MTKEAVVVVDMQRGFLEEQYPLYCGPGARAIIPKVHRFVEEKRGEGVPVFWTQDWHETDDKEFTVWPVHCLRQTREAEIIPELADLVDETRLIRKARYSGFHQTDLWFRLKGHGAERVHFAGVCTDICVLHSVADLRLLDFSLRIVVHRELVASFDEEAHGWALKHMEGVLKAEVG